MKIVMFRDRRHWWQKLFWPIKPELVPQEFQIALEQLKSTPKSEEKFALVRTDFEVELMDVPML
jgi:hypothetical protein